MSIFQDRGEMLKGFDPLATSPPPDSNGHFSTPMTVPFTSSAGSVFYACQRCGDADSEREAGGLLTVVPPLTPAAFIDPAVAQPGSAVSVTGTGWNPVDGLVTIFPSADDATDPTAALGMTDAGPTGNIATSIVAPATLGDLVLFACQDCGNSDGFPSATAALTVQTATPSATPRSVVVPNVVGDTAPRARRVLIRQGLAPAILWIGSGRERGSAVAQTPVAGTRARPGATVTVTARRTAVIVIAPVGRSWTRPAISGGALLILVVLAAALFWWRPHRQRIWVHRHVRTEPRPGPPAEVAVRDLDHTVERTVRFELHRDRGTQTLEEVGA